MTRSRLGTGVAVCRLLPWFIAFGMVKGVVSLQTLVRWSWRTPRRSGRADIRKIASHVFRAGAVAGLPDRDCLQRSLLLYRELSGAGFGPELAMGFQRVDGRLVGHAWGCVAGTAIGEPDLDTARYVGIVKFGDRGELVTALS
jgi:hypothetical protein